MERSVNIGGVIRDLSDEVHGRQGEADEPGVVGSISNPDPVPQRLVRLDVPRVGEGCFVVLP